MAASLLSFPMKGVLRRIPGLFTTYRGLQILAFAAYDRWWADRQLTHDRYLLNGHWRFEEPHEQERHRKVLDAVTSERGTASWGDVLEIGCAEGLFTEQLLRRSASVTVYDVSTVACDRITQKWPDVRVQRLNIESDAIPGTFDLVFVMAVLAYVPGRDRLARVSAKLAGALRAGGLLIFNDTRLQEPETENSWWARWLIEGGVGILKYLDGRHGLCLIHQEIHPQYVIGIYEKRA